MGLLEFRGFGLSGEDPDICLDLVSGFMLLPGVRGRDWIVPRLDGQQAGNRRLDKLVLPVAGLIKGSGATSTARREDLLVNVSAVMAVMDPSLGLGTLRLSAGYLGLPVGSEATIEARCRNGAPGRMQNSQSAQVWTFELEAPIPGWDIGS